MATRKQSAENCNNLLVGIGKIISKSIGLFSNLFEADQRETIPSFLYASYEKQRQKSY